jgi:hydroxyisourate hydrolase
MAAVTSAGSLTTHVLDVARGRPAAGVAIELARIASDGEIVLASVETNADGRTDEPLVAPGALEAGIYELRFAIGAYFAGAAAAAGTAADGDGIGDPPFLDVVPVRFGIADADAHHHVPLLATPWSYSTYRGS